MEDVERNPAPVPAGVRTVTAASSAPRHCSASVFVDSYSAFDF